MCGIYLTNLPFEKKQIKDKLKSISFRGPDHTGYEKINNISFGHLRLSILDLDPRSNQPMHYKELVIVFNGEIYNYLEVKEQLIELGYELITESDTEVLLIGYYHWGQGILERINGMFAFSIYNKETNFLFSARDRLGVKPFYYYWHNNNLEICSQLRPILENKELNDEAISIYLDVDYIPSPFTIAKHVYKLPPGNFMEIDFERNRLEINEYWNLQNIKTKNISYEEAKHELHNLLKDAVKIRLQSDVPIGAFLSGGIDSSLISSIASEVSNTQINTFSIGFDDPEYDESKIAEKYADIIGSNHTTTICKPGDFMELIDKLVEVYDEPFADSSALPTLLLNKITKQYVTVALAGDGADESFLGYSHFDSLIKNRPIMKIPYQIRKFLSRPFFLNLINQNTHRVRNALNTQTENDFIENIFSRKGFLLKSKNQKWMKYYEGYKKWSNSFIQKAADLNIKLWLENDSNVKIDRGSMAYSVEVRSPFLDYRVVEFARSLPVEYRFKRGRQKRILKDILKNYIPEELFNQPKSGFSVPIAEWMRNELKEEFDSNLNDEFLQIVPNLNIPKFKKLYRDHMNGKEDHRVHIWKLFVLSKWYKEFGFL